MKKEHFIQYCYTLLPGDINVGLVWWDWVNTLSELDRNTSDPGAAFNTPEMYLDEIYEIVEEMRRKYSDQVASQIISLANLPACPYVWEIKDIAEYFASGGEINEIPRLQAEGSLEDLTYYFKIQERVRAQGDTRDDEI